MVRFSASCAVFASLAVSSIAQSPQRPAPRVRTLTFSNAKPVLGFPLGEVVPLGCSSDNLSFFTTSAPSSGLPALYSVSASGEVKRLLRAAPIEYNSVSVIDFFAADRHLVTLIQAEKTEPDKPPRDTSFLLSLADHDSGETTLLPLNLHFKPLRIALFGSGEYLLLGWDEANLLPVLAILKEDGTVRRFLDFDEQKPGERPVAHASVKLDALQGAAFVPFGNELLLTYPLTAKPLRVLSANGGASSLTLALPGGYLLHDVLVTDLGRIVARVQMSEDLKAELGKAAGNFPAQRLFEFNSYTGKQIQEFTFTRQTPADISCAAGQSLTAIFLDTPGTPDPGADPHKPSPSQWVVGTVRR